MIKLTSICKIYRSNKREKCLALNNINLTLPDSGLVFVLGKSGSGKSTLLNLIGGLDNFTSGTIEVDGNVISHFNERKFCNYRNTHIGFIFQDYHLIDELTVYENIALSLNLRRMKDRGDVALALQKVGLAGYEDRFPTELSGGERQRVAIARAIVKKPRIILADEPTGNLDTATAQSVVGILKTLAQDCLIIVVSHNIHDANTYADRIVELRNGEIISDRTRNPNFAPEVTVTDVNLVYPKGRELSDKDIDLINANQTKKLIKRTDEFIPTAAVVDTNCKVEIECKKLSLLNELHLSDRFLKNKTPTIAVSAFVVAIIMTIMSVANTITAFRPDRIIAEELRKDGYTTMYMLKVVDEETNGMLQSEPAVAVTESDIQAFYDGGYKGDIYPVLNYTLPTKSSLSGRLGYKRSQISSVYTSESFGTIVVDEDFLNKKFGGLTYAARLDEFRPYGILITDYLADCILVHNTLYSGKSYQDILGVYIWSSNKVALCYINGIIDTGYRTQYKDMLDRYQVQYHQSSSSMRHEEAFQKFSADLCSRLAYCYTTNPDFVKDRANGPDAAFASYYKLAFNGVAYDAQYSLCYLSTGIINSDVDALKFSSNWYYSTNCPDIPDGARYIRIAFDDAISHPMAEQAEAKLVFSDGTAASDDELYAVNYKGGGVMLNAYTGKEERTTTGLNHTFVSDYIPIPEGASITGFESIAYKGYAFCAFYDEDKVFISSVNAPQNEYMAEKSIRMNMTTYNQIFGTSYTKDTVESFVPHTVTMAHYEHTDLELKNPLFTTEVTIAKLLSSSGTGTIYASDDIHQLFYADSIRANSLYFDGEEGLGTLLGTADTLLYEQLDYTLYGIHSMAKVVNTFVPIFELVMVFLCAGAVFVLVIFASKMINGKMHEIGILKALGTQNSTVGKIFGLQVGLIAALSCVLTTVGYYFTVGLTNTLLIESLHAYASTWVIPDLDFLVFKPEIAVFNCLLTFALTAVSLVIPLIKIKSIKPVKIIKAKE